MHFNEKKLEDVHRGLLMLMCGNMANSIRMLMSLL